MFHTCGSFQYIWNIILCDFKLIDSLFSPLINVLLHSGAIPNPLSFPLTACFQFKSRKPLVYFQSCIFLCPCWANSIILMCWLNKHVIFFLILLPCKDDNLVLGTVKPHVVKVNFFAACFTPWTSYWACFLFFTWNQTAVMIHFVPLSFILSFCLIICTLLISTSLLPSACHFAKYATPLGEAWHHVPAALSDAAKTTSSTFVCLCSKCFTKQFISVCNVSLNSLLTAKKLF